MQTINSYVFIANKISKQLANLFFTHRLYQTPICLIIIQILFKAFRICKSSYYNNTRTRKNMKTKPVLLRYERQLLNQRGIIETVIWHLKHCYQVWHTRHRSIMNALTHLVAALAAYAIQPLQLEALKMLVNCSK